MKKIIVCVALLAGLSYYKADAQWVRRRPAFGVGVSVGPAPYPGAIWVGPEWEWRGGRYVEVPGYWARPKGPRAYWVPGHWKATRRGERWIPGHWR
jgi:hypothetical protein